MVKTVANRDVAKMVRDRMGNYDGYGATYARMFPEGISVAVYWHSWLPDSLKSIMGAREDCIKQVIFSYNTPIAWNDSGVWIMPDANYSPTSGKHQSYVRYDIDTEPIPLDCTMEDYLRVVEGQMRFVGSGKNMRTKPGIARI